nr:hypothetical protein [Tanacetum cinerariifolium]
MSENLEGKRESGAIEKPLEGGFLYSRWHLRCALCHFKLQVGTVVVTLKMEALLLADLDLFFNRVSPTLGQKSRSSLLKDAQGWLDLKSRVITKPVHTSGTRTNTKHYQHDSLCDEVHMFAQLNSVLKKTCKYSLPLKRWLTNVYNDGVTGLSQSMKSESETIQLFNKSMFLIVFSHARKTKETSGGRKIDGLLSSLQLQNITHYSKYYTLSIRPMMWRSDFVNSDCRSFLSFYPPDCMCIIDVYRFRRLSLNFLNNRYSFESTIVGRIGFWLYQKPKFLIKMPPKRNSNIYDVYERIMARMKERLDQFVDQFTNQMNDMMNPKIRGDRNGRRSEGKESENSFFEVFDDDPYKEEIMSGDVGVNLVFKDELEMGDDAFVLTRKEVVPNSKIPEAMFPLLEEFFDVFPDELHDALPPLMSPGEHELRRQVEELVSKGHVRERMSPCAQPHGPLDLMSLHVSGSVPKKVQNFVKGLPYHGDSSDDDLVGNSRTNFVYPWGNDEGPSIEERALLFLEVQDHVKENAKKFRDA